MGIEDSFIWYQKKIGTYDKQQWETTIEQRILSGLTNIPMRNTKPNTDLIDLDLVRGSSFTKAKPQHGFMKVIKLATLRCAFLPFYWRFWIQQSSKVVFTLFLLLYLSLWINLVIYYFIPDTVPYTELIIPLIMMWILTLVLSQIVSTKPISDSKVLTKNRHYRRKRFSLRKANSARAPTRRIKIMEPSVNEDEEKSDSSRKSSIHCDEETKKINAMDICKCTNTNSIKKVDQMVHFDSKRDPFDFDTDRSSSRKVQIKDEGFESLGSSGTRTEDILSSLGEEIPSSPNSLKECLKCRPKKDIENRSNSESRPYTSDSESDDNEITTNRYLRRASFSRNLDCHYDSEEEYNNYLGDTISGDWMGVTTNSEECSCPSDMEDVLDDTNYKTTYEYDYSPTAILKTPSAKVSCIIWDRKESKKADLTMLDISSSIIRKVDIMPESMNYFYMGLVISAALALIPIISKVSGAESCDNNSTNDFVAMEYDFVFDEVHSYLNGLLQKIGGSLWERVFIVLCTLQRFALSSCFFFLLSVAERTFKQRFLYAKLFCHLTSFRRAQKSKLPHFRLNKVRNIKTWLSVRSYLKKRGPQRSVDVIVSTAFIIMIFLMSCLCVELLNDTLSLNSQYNIEALIWCCGLGILLLRFLTLGTKINKKYRNLSVLLTEQINLHLQIEQKPHKKEELTVANNVLKLAIDLLKELESPFKIIGLSANPILVNITKVVILSALSGVLSDMLGFKLKLHKIKIK